MSVPSDGTRRVQWQRGHAEAADTTTGQTGATPTPKPTQKDSTSASAEDQFFSAFGRDLRDIVVPAEPYPTTYEGFRKRLEDRMRSPEVKLPEFLMEPEPPSPRTYPDVLFGKQGYLVRITDEQLGLAEVWPVEQVSAEAQAAARKEREREQRQRLITITAKLATAHEALHPIIELHSPGTQAWSADECQGCDAGAYAEESPEWPCRTINLILEGLE